MTMKTRFAALATAVLLTAAPVASASADVLGGLIGAATGGWVGSHIGDGRGQLAATAAGTLLGYGIGDNLTDRGYGQPTRTRYVSTPAPRRVVYVESEPEVIVVERPRRHWRKRTVVIKETRYVHPRRAWRYWDD